MGTPLNWATVNIPRGKRANLWGKLAVPGAGARLGLHTDGTPLTASNPTAVHLGRTTEGAELRYRASLQLRASDEFDAPFDTNIETVEAILVANIMPTLDTSIMELLMVGATKASGSGYEELAFGGKSSASANFSSFALVYELPEDATKFGVVHLYNAINDEQLAVRIRRSGNVIGSTPIALRGFSVASRAAGDQVGKWWKQVV